MPRNPRDEGFFDADRLSRQINKRTWIQVKKRMRTVDPAQGVDRLHFYGTEIVKTYDCSKFQLLWRQGTRTQWCPWISGFGPLKHAAIAASKAEVKITTCRKGAEAVGQKSSLKLLWYLLNTQSEWHQADRIIPFSRLSECIIQLFTAGCGSNATNPSTRRLNLKYSLWFFEYFSKNTLKTQYQPARNLHPIRMP